MSDSGQGQNDRSRDVSSNTPTKWSSDAHFDRVRPDATEKSDGGPHAKRQIHGSTAEGSELANRRSDLSEKIQVSKQIANMQEPRRMNRDDLDERRIIYPESPDRNLVNRFRQLRTQLLEVSNNNNFSLVVTSAMGSGGASFTAVNLAAAFAFDQSKTAVLVDCNLRYPSLHSLLDIMPDAGLTDFIEDPEYDIGRIIYPTGIPRLRLIPAGSRRESPSEFFTSYRMGEFIDAIRERYPDRFIILDTASIADSPDARILSELCDYTMLVVPHGRVTTTQVEHAVGGIDPSKFVGAILNA